jgi:hypothetical protein
MNKKLLVCITLFFSLSFLAESNSNFITNGNYSTKLRFYNFYKDFKTPKSNSSFQKGTSLGGQVSYQTGQLYHLSGKVTFATANNLSLAATNTSQQSPILPSKNLSTISESFLMYSNFKTSLKLGSQVLETPFANSSDAMMIPATYTGLSVNTKIIPQIDMTLGRIDSFRARDSNDFVNVQKWTLQRYNSSTNSNSKKMNIARVVYNPDNFKVDLNYINLDDIMDISFLELQYKFTNTTFRVQAGKQQDNGTKGIGEIDNTLLGYLMSYKDKKFLVSLGYTNLSSKTQSSWLEPFSFFTSPLYTNSMLSGFGNIGLGNGYKVKTAYNVLEDLSLVLTYSDLNFNVDTKDKSELNFNVVWKVSKYPGLTLVNRISQISSGNVNNETLAVRTQLQYVF